MNKRFIFNIPYRTQWGQLMRIVANSSPSFEEKSNIYIELSTLDGNHWQGESIDLPTNFYYKYEVLDIPRIIEEVTRPRYIDATFILLDTISINDFWRSEANKNNIFYSSAFSEVIFKPNQNKSYRESNQNENNKANVSFRLNAPDIPKNKKLGVLGNIGVLGNWLQPVILQCENYPEWRTDVFIHNDVGIVEYKYVLVDEVDQSISYWEIENNRQVPTNLLQEHNYLILHDDGFRYGGGWWRGTGMAIPVFSLRTQNSCGIGEFSDLKTMIDLADKMGMDIIQTLPVNDTLANMNWQDSYPYAAISVYALHPLY
ncbi:MAG TPA: 4-alpha-glucanotransferase, partial [Saprospiraceae bacterium]|nr:4-alpha-glucanotransferase [Saprospiraceae bacterium]